MSEIYTYIFDGICTRITYFSAMVRIHFTNYIDFTDRIHLLNGSYHGLDMVVVDQN